MTDWKNVLKKIAPQAKGSIVDAMASVMDEELARGNISTPLRKAHFLAQIAHESDSFRTTEEYASGSAYENRRDLGNVNPGDGRRYKGRGVLQLTGRANYRKYGAYLGLPLEENPTLAAEPAVSVKIAVEYWMRNALNDYADNDDILTITKRINGGTNGLEDRKAKLLRAKAALATPIIPVANRPLLMIGAKGDAVKALQEALKVNGFPLVIDGDFGRITQGAVIRFQAANGLVPDGIVGNLTWTALEDGE